jgi:hypothetical protein
LVIVPPLSLEKAGFIMTVCSLTAQSILLRIAPTSSQLS